MEKILILGGTQFIGKALVCGLAKSQMKERQIICFHRGKHPLPEVCGVHEILGDRFLEKDIKALFSQDYDMVIDVSGTEYEAIKFAVKYAQGHTNRYVFISSSSVYDSQKGKVHMETEALDSLGKSDYAAAKIMGERLVEECFSNHTIVRPSKVYGPENYYFSEKDFANLVKRNPCVPLKRDPILHFTNIKDLTEGILYLLQQNRVGIYNVAGKEPVHLSEFIQKIAELTGQKVCFRQSNESNVLFSDLEDRILDCTKIKQECGWYPKISIDEGLKKIF